MLDKIKRLADVGGVKNLEGDDLFEIVKFRDELRPEKGRELLYGKSAVAMSGATGIDKTTNNLLVNRFELGQVKLSENGNSLEKKEN